MMKSITQRGLRYFLYFKRGHNTYLAAMVGLGSTTGIWYVLLGFDAFFISILTFAAIFVPSYIFGCMLLGWQDFKRGVYQREIEVSKAENTITIEILDSLREILEILRKERE